MFIQTLVLGTVLSVLTTTGSISSGAESEEHADANFERSQLVAWCIVPFDAAKRGPAERAEMVADLGMKRIAYDWRDEHVASFEEEILQYKKHGIEFFAFWSWHPDMEPLIRKHKIHPQIWMMFAALDNGTQEEKTQAAANSLLPMVQKTASLGLKLGLYNHGGWSGEPANMVAVCKYLRKHHAAEHVGIVYNLHHGHEHINDFADQLKVMQPYLLCLNLNGMNDKASPKILPIGNGQHEVRMIGMIRDANYTGPIGILDHRPEMDSREALQFNLTGLQHVLQKLGATSAAATYSAKPASRQ